ncbi:MAG: SRPBCC domain-containing protein [Polyangiaceae bacterium]
MSEEKSSVLEGATFRSRRVVGYSPEAVFQAFTRGESLAKWWGPAGFTNTFEVFEFRSGGQWKFVMHGPGGGSYKNESTFVEVTEPSKVVIQHLSSPRYVLTIAIAAHEGGAEIRWDQEFEEIAVAERIQKIVGPANEQNLDRMEAVLAGKKP